MQRDPLRAALGLRRRAVDEARRALANCTDAAATAANAARRLEAEIETEMDRAADPSGSDRLVESFAAWLPGARNRAAQARATQEQYEAEAARLRAELSACRTAQESTEALIERREFELTLQRGRSMQREMDELSVRRVPS